MQHPRLQQSRQPRSPGGIFSAICGAQGRGGQLGRLQVKRISPWQPGSAQPTPIAALGWRLTGELFAALCNVMVVERCVSPTQITGLGKSLRFVLHESTPSLDGFSCPKKWFQLRLFCSCKGVYWCESEGWFPLAVLAEKPSSLQRGAGHGQGPPSNPNPSGAQSSHRVPSRCLLLPPAPAFAHAAKRQEKGQEWC